MGVTRIESNRNRHFGLKIESKSIENRNLEIVTSLVHEEKDLGVVVSNDLKASRAAFMHLADFVVAFFTVGHCRSDRQTYNSNIVLCHTLRTAEHKTTFL